MAPKRVIGVDLGGTKILTASLDGRGRVLDRLEVPTPTVSQDELVAAIAESIEAVAGPGFDALGLGIPSVLDRTNGRVLGSIGIRYGFGPLATADA